MLVGAFGQEQAKQGLLFGLMLLSNPYLNSWTFWFYSTMFKIKTYLYILNLIEFWKDLNVIYVF